MLLTVLIIIEFHTVPCLLLAVHFNVMTDHIQPGTSKCRAPTSPGPSGSEPTTFLDLGAGEYKMAYWAPFFSQKHRSIDNHYLELIKNNHVLNPPTRLVYPGRYYYCSKNRSCLTQPCASRKDGLLLVHLRVSYYLCSPLTFWCWLYMWLIWLGVAMIELRPDLKA